MSTEHPHALPKVPPVWVFYPYHDDPYPHFALMLPQSDPLREFAIEATKLAMEQIAVLVARQRDYGPENISRGGDGGLMIRINDKFERAWYLHVSGAEPTGEAVDDTDIDLANYALIRRMGRRGVWPVPFRKIVLREVG